MNIHLHRPLAISFLLIAFVSLQLLSLQTRATEKPKLERELDYLIEEVRTSGCIFERNGSRHTAKEAAAHLQLKLKNGRKHVESAEDFIDKLASKSSWTGKPYYLHCPKVSRSLVSFWLHDKLTNLRIESNLDAL